jgi:hypothetical protein
MSQRSRLLAYQLAQSLQEDLRSPFPYLAEYLMQEAVSYGIIQRDELPYWRTVFDPACPDPSLPLWHDHEDKFPRGG